MAVAVGMPWYVPWHAMAQHGLCCSIIWHIPWPAIAYAVAYQYDSAFAIAYACHTQTSHEDKMIWATRHPNHLKC